MTIQELILEVWKQRSERVAEGLKPSKLLLHKDRYRELVLYKASLGDLPEGQIDYIGEDFLFDLEICLDNRIVFKVI